ncbi:MAG: copper resistance protein B [Phenylobacterium sp.]|jgi:copper resistance protein B
MRVLAVAAMLFATPAVAQDSQATGETGQRVAAHAHGDRTYTFTQAQADYSRQDGADVVNWDAEGWIGGDLNKFWWKTEGERSGSDVEKAEVQALYSRNVWTFFDAQAGIRADVEPDSRGYGVIGVQGLAPGLLETELHAYFGFKGDVSIRLKQSFDVRLTNHFVLEPHVETDFYLTDEPARLIGSGFSTVEAGVEARYEIHRKFMPTLAVIYESRLGDSARLARRAGEDAGGWSVRGGLRFWF